MRSIRAVDPRRRYRLPAAGAWRLPLLATWLRRPHVARWWSGGSDLPSVERKYSPRITGEAPTEVFVVDLASRPIGLIQRYLIQDHPEWRDALPLPDGGAVGIDYLIGEPAATGRGLGATMIDAFAALAFDRYPQARLIVAVPQQDNVASCRALDRAGFRIAWSGVVRSGDPADRGPSHLYVRWRADAARSSRARRA